MSTPCKPCVDLKCPNPSDFSLYSLDSGPAPPTVNSQSAACRNAICETLDCPTPNDFELYSLDGLAFFTNPAFYLVGHCYPGFVCVSNDTPVVIPANTLPPVNVPINSPIDNPIRLKCCDGSYVTGIVPAGSTLAATQTIMNGLYAQVAQKKADCVVNQGNVPVNTLRLECQSCPASVCLNSQWSGTVAASGGKYPYSFSITGVGTITNNNDGTATITVTPSTPGPQSIGVTVKDSSSPQLSNFLQITIGAIGLTNATLASACVGTNYSASVSATGGVGPYVYAFSNVAYGSPPAWLEWLNTSTGALYSLLGHPPNATGTFTFGILITDINGVQCNVPVTLVVNGVTIISGSPPTSGTVCAAYNWTMTANPLVGTTFSATLPLGLSINATSGVISGTTTALGTQHCKVIATNTNGCTATQEWDVTVAAIDSHPRAVQDMVWAPTTYGSGGSLSVYTSVPVTAKSDSALYFCGSTAFALSVVVKVTNPSNAFVTLGMVFAGVSITGSVTITDSIKTYTVGIPAGTWVAGSLCEFYADIWNIGSYVQVDMTITQ